MLQAHSSERRKREGACTEDVRQGLGHNKLLILWQIMAKEVLKNDIRGKAYLHIPGTNSRKTK